MTLENFESEIEVKILERGLDYYESGQVTSLELDGKYWVAEVSGTDDYAVEIELSKTGKITSMNCDCPYDLGPVCKHETAVLYALREMGEEAMKTAGPTKIEKLKSALENAGKEDLAAIILGYAKKSKSIRDELLTRFAGETDLLNSVRNSVRSSIKNAMTGGFVEYRDVGSAVEGAGNALNIAGSRNDAGDFMTAVSICIVILREMMELLNDCDDSDGIVGEVIDTAVQLIQGSASRNAASANGNKELFNLVFSHAKEKIYDEWDDWRFEILEGCVPFCADASLRKKLETYLGSFVLAKHDDSHERWMSNQAQKILYDIIETFDGSEAAGAYIEKNMEHNEDFRKIAVEKAVAAKDYNRALKLCFDGEQKNEKYPGLVNDYQRKRYEIYEKQKDVSGQKELAYAFVLDGEFDYYKKLKKLYTKTEWSAVLADLLAKMESGDHSGQAYIDICIHEHFWEKLLTICKKQPYYLDELYSYLIPQYASELEPLFTAAIKKEAENSGSRSGYQKACGLIRHYIKACGKSGAKELITELRETYRRRPAFIDELGKIKI